MLNFNELNEIKGDASFRKFYRNKKKRSIIVYARKEKVKNLLIYDAINKILIKNKILAPKLLIYKDIEKKFRILPHDPLESQWVLVAYIPLSNQTPLCVRSAWFSSSCCLMRLNAV